MFGTSTQENLDPRRTQRGRRTRDFGSTSRVVAVPRIHVLLARVLVRLGVTR